MTDVSVAAQYDLGSFYDYLYDERQGYVHAATKEGSGAWKEFFFQWPVQRAELIRFTELNRSGRDVYVAPAMFRTNTNARKENVQGANLVWIEIDGNVPTELDGVPPPTLRIASGGEGHEHWYWKLDRELNTEQLELVNRALTIKFDSDESGSDATQVLRPPFTFNHKRKRETAFVAISDVKLNPGMFSSLPVPPPVIDAAPPDEIPPVEQVVAKYQFSEEVRNLFFEGGNTLKEDGTPVRYKAIMQLGYFLAEMGMSGPEILSMLINADDRWGKFAGRSDRLRRLMEVVTIAQRKYPQQSIILVDGQPEPQLSPKLVPMGFKTLLATEVNLEWQWEGLLERHGYFLLTGKSGVGKTQFSLDAAGHMVNGMDFLGRPTKPSRIGFFSLEMGIEELQFFLKSLQYAFTEEQQAVMEENLLFFPLGEPLYMTSEGVRNQLDQLVGDLKLDGIMVDSLGSASEDMMADEAFRKFFHWNSQFRQRHGVFTWYLHHNRKGDGSRKPNKLEDVYGSQYITSEATSVVTLWDSGVPNVIDYLPLKMRLAAKPPPFQIARDANLHFTKLVGAPKQLGTSGQPVAAGDRTAAVLGGAYTPVGSPQGGGWSVSPMVLSEPDSTPSDVIEINLGGLK